MSRRETEASSRLTRLLADSVRGNRPTAAETLSLLPHAPLAALQPVAEALALAGHGRAISFSRKVFIPLTQLCRDVCHYCTFAKAPRRLPAPYLALDEVLDLAHAGAGLDINLSKNISLNGDIRYVFLDASNFGEAVDSIADDYNGDFWAGTIGLNFKLF